jgi:hypothetical protein
MYNETGINTITCIHSLRGKRDIGRPEIDGKTRLNSEPGNGLQFFSAYEYETLGSYGGEFEDQSPLIVVYQII